MAPFEAPKFEGTAFNCPKCNAYAKQSWSYVFIDDPESDDYLQIDENKVSLCAHCEKITVWEDEKMVHPAMRKFDLPAPNEDLDEEIKSDFVEACEILHLSPRGSAALLRLCLQKLCVQLGERGININDDIASLVQKGLDVRVQQALDIVRVIGNNAVHPGALDIKDDHQTAINLLKLINLIAEIMISQPKHVKSLYSSLPTNALSAIARRDSTK